MLDLIASYLVRGVNILFHFLPIGFVLWAGRGFGRIIYYLSGKRKHITYANLKAAFHGEKTPEELRRISKGVYAQVGQTFAEILSMTKMDKRYTKKYINVKNLDIALKASKNPNGAILITAHYGNWELLTVKSVHVGLPLYLLARDQKMERLNELLNLLRESKGNVVIRKGLDIKNIFKVLRSGKNVGIVADQNAGPNGILLDLFGRPASTAIGPYRIAQKSGAWVLPAFIHRVKGPYHEVELEEPMIIKKDEDVAGYMKRYNEILEKHVRAYPDHWFWMHKKWKMTPVKRIMVLDDGKKGHLKQSLAVVKQIKRYRQEEGFSPDDTPVDIVEIAFRNKTARTLLNLFSPFLTAAFNLHLKCLEAALDENSFKRAVNRYADVIISCGSSLFGINRILKIENHARSLTVLDPGSHARGKFDLVVKPKHDVKAKEASAENVIITDLAPNLIEPGGLRSFGDELGKEFAARKGLKIGLLIGGDNPHFHFSEDLIRSVSSGTKQACERLGGYFFVTTSRRTSDLAERTASSILAQHPACLKFVSGKNDPDEHTVEKILALCDMIIVSGESISMVSEAVSSGKTVLVFMPDKKMNNFTKYDKFVRDLEEMKYLKVVDVKRIGEEIELAMTRKEERVLPDDDRRIREKMYKLF